MFSGITEKETQTLVEAIAQITVLIAGADGKIERDETDWAVKLTNIRSYSYKDELKPFYAKVGEGFARKLDDLIDISSSDTTERTAALTKSLAKLGGFLRFGAISKEEKALMSLPMVNEIEYIEVVDESE